MTELDFKPLYYADRLSIINPQGYSGIVTLWSKPEVMWKKLQTNYPKLFETSSPLVTLTSLYGNGLPQMLANMAFNPQIERIGITGGETDSIRSSEYLMNFFSQGVEPIEIGGVKMNRIKGTEFSIDQQLNPALYNPNIEIQKFKQTDLEGLVNFISNERKTHPTEDQRIKIELTMPKFKDFPSDIYNHVISGKTPIHAWVELMYHLDRYGVNLDVPKRKKAGDKSETLKEKRRALFGVQVAIEDASFEDHNLLRSFNFSPEGLRGYAQEVMLNPELPTDRDEAYTYGNRLRRYWGGDTLEQIAKMLREEPLNRHCLTSLWNPKTDLFMEESSPCFTDAYFVNVNGDLVMSSTFRTHNAVKAWFENVYGLRAIQEKVANESGLKPGSMKVTSRWIGIDPSNAGTVAALELVKKNFRADQEKNDPKRYFDPRGTFTTEVEGSEIVMKHYNLQGTLIEEYRGKDAKDVKNQLWSSAALSNPDHAMWIGYELARAQLELKGKIEEM